MSDLLTAAEADALAAQFKPNSRAGVHTWTPRTLESYRELDRTLTRPVTDMVQSPGVRASDVIVVRAAPSSRAEQRAWGKAESKRRRKHVAAEQRRLGQVWDLSVVRVLRRAALAESWALR